MEKQVIYGNIPSKSNSYKIITINGHASLAKTKAVKDYEKSFYIQCNKYREANIQGYFELYADVFFPSERSDLDNCAKILLDSLAVCKAFKNDNKCVKLYLRKFKDAKNPRVEFVIKPVNLDVSHD